MLINTMEGSPQTKCCLHKMLNNNVLLAQMSQDDSLVVRNWEGKPWHVLVASYKWTWWITMMTRFVIACLKDIDFGKFILKWLWYNHDNCKTLNNCSVTPQSSQQVAKNCSFVSSVFHLQMQGMLHVVLFNVLTWKSG